MIDLDPRDPRTGGHENPLARYLTVPNGIGVVAAIQVLIGILFAYTAFRQYQVEAAGVNIASLCALSALFLIIGIAFWKCRAWAWWSVAAVYSFLATDSASNVIRGTGPEVRERALLLIIAVFSALAIIVYIYRSVVIRHMSFRRPPGPWLRLSPMVVGVALGAATIVRTVR